MTEKYIREVFDSLNEFMRGQHPFTLLNKFGAEPNIRMVFARKGVKSFMGRVYSSPARKLDRDGSWIYYPDHPKSELWGLIQINQYYLEKDATQYDLVETIIHELVHIYYNEIHHPETKRVGWQNNPNWIPFQSKVEKFMKPAWIWLDEEGLI